MQMMRSILVIVIALAIIGCNGDDGGGESSNTATLNLKESGIVTPPSEELKAQGYNDKYEMAQVVIPGEAIVSDEQEKAYTNYRKKWKRINNNPTNGYRLVDGHIEANLDNLSFREAFKLQYRAHGNGHTFWWQGKQYTTDLLQD